MKKVLVAASILALASSATVFAAKGGNGQGNNGNGNGNGGSQTSSASAGSSSSAKTKVIIKDVAKIANLEMSQITIGVGDISEARAGSDFSEQIGKFCSYTNDAKKRMQLAVATDQEGFNIVGSSINVKGLEVPYTLALGSTIYNAPGSKEHIAGGDNDVNCSTYEPIMLTVKASNVIAAKAGTYDIGLQLTSKPVDK
ncbi:hypothetical protein N8865_00745 [Francisellaceae bacterium]|nr:hypothetical protein [Francisellaceae bacterium]